MRFQLKKKEYRIPVIFQSGTIYFCGNIVRVSHFLSALGETRPGIIIKCEPCKFAASPCRDLRNASNSFRRAKSFFRLWNGRGAIKLLLVRTSRRHSIFGM